MAGVKVHGLHRVAVRDDKGKPGTAQVEISYRRMMVRPPIGTHKRYPTLVLTLLPARESEEPVGRPRIDWKWYGRLPPFGGVGLAGEKWTPTVPTASSVPMMEELILHGQTGGSEMDTTRTVVGVDPSKRVFRLYWVEPKTGECMGAMPTRAKFLEHFVNRAPCLVAMEACGGSQHWARQLLEFGHEVRLIPAKKVRPFVGGNKNDRIRNRRIGEMRVLEVVAESL